jgi:TonB family protein
VSARPTKRRPATAQTLGLGFLAAVAVHVVVVGTVEALRDPPVPIALPLEGAGLATAATDDPLLEPPLEPTCAGDAVLTAAARSTACLTPWAVDLETCLATARVAYDAERERCRTNPDPVNVQIVSMTPEQIARIDPEPLLDLLDAAAQMKFEQQQQQQQVAQLVKEEQKRQQEMVKQQAQVVETAKPTTEVTPDQARFLAEYDTKVQKETVARGSRDEKMVAKSQAESLQAKPNARDPSVKEPPPDRPPGTNKEAPDVPGKLSMRSPGAIVPSQTPQEAKTRGRYMGWQGPLGDGLDAKRGDGSIDQQRREADESRGGGGAGGGAPAVPDLKPSEDVLERALGGGSVDHLDSIADGDETALNAKRWVYASFFNRLKRQVAQNWEPGDVWRRHDPNGSVYGFKSRVTQLRVSLDAKGKLMKTPTVVKACGVDVLDDEAIRAFQASAPFPNPPDGLAQDGQITFEFSFHFEIGAPKTSWRILRQM